MDSALILRRDSFSLVELNVKGNHIAIQKCFSEHCMPLSQALATAEDATVFLETLLDVEAVKQTRFSIVLTPGSGIAYKTWQVVHSSLVDPSDKTVEAREERILSLCTENMPEGITDLYDNYTPTVVSCYEDDTSTVTSCYVPSLYLINLKAACDALGITLFAVTDAASCFYRIIDPNEGPLFLRSDGLISAINSFGIMSWITPANCTDSLLQYFASLSEKFYPLQDVLGHSTSVSIEKIMDHLKVIIDGANDLSIEDAVLASGCVVDVKQLKKSSTVEIVGQLEKGDVVGSAISQLRKLFNQK